MSAPPLPATGVLAGGIHRLPVRVYYEDTDAAGIVYHASYFRFTERARTEMMRAAGVALTVLARDAGVMFVVHGGAVEFLKPARLDDILIVETTIGEVGAASLKLRQSVRRYGPEAGTPDEILFRFDPRIACVDLSARPKRLPKDLQERLKSHITTATGHDRAMPQRTRTG